jgi:hypothetical protein
MAQTNVASITVSEEHDDHIGQLDLNSSMRSVAYWESSLFSKVYLDNDLKRDFSDRWTSDYDDAVFNEAGDTVKAGFYHFYNEFRNIAKSLRAHNKKTLTETDTITKIITPAPTRPNSHLRLKRVSQ